MSEEAKSRGEALKDLRIKSLSFLQFRNYESLKLDNLDGLTVFIGRNAAGKTNILEGLQLLTSAYSFRNPLTSQLLRDDSVESRISLRADDGNRDIEISLLISEGNKRYSVNGKKKSAADVRGILPSVMFTPDDLQLVKKSSSVKRAALDDLGMQLTRNYYVVRKDYEKTIRYKNHLLKEGAPQILVESINETLVTCAAQLFCMRTALFERMLPFVKEAYSLISGNEEDFTALYKPSWMKYSKNEKYDFPKTRDDARMVIACELEKRKEEERERGRSLIGPHSDEILFLLGGCDAADYASQGQQRSIVLAWKLAEVQMVREILGVQPILLLDDVLSELDKSRREMLVQFVTDDIQTFVTATDLDGFSSDFIDRANVISLPC